MTQSKLHFSQALPCINCEQPTQQGLISPMRSLAWQLVPLCEQDIGQLACEEVSCSNIADLQNQITRQLQVIHQLQRRRQHLARAYLRLRRQHAHHKARRALRIGLNRSYRQQVQAIEEVIA